MRAEKLIIFILAILLLACANSRKGEEKQISEKPAKIALATNYEMHMALNTVYVLVADANNVKMEIEKNPLVGKEEIDTRSYLLIKDYNDEAKEFIGDGFSKCLKGDNVITKSEYVDAVIYVGKTLVPAAAKFRALESFKK